MTGTGGAIPPVDLLSEAVEGMDRPLFVLDDGWRFRYVNAAGARVLDRTAEQLLGSVVWQVFPEAVGGPFQELYFRVRATGESGSAEAWYEPLGKWFRADAFLTSAGLVVTYDDVTERRRTEEERAAAVAAREVAASQAAAAAAEAELAGRHLLLLGDINLAMTSTFDVDEAVDRFAHLVVPVLGDWCVVSVVEDGVRRDVGRAHRRPEEEPALHRYADLRVTANSAAAPVPRMLRDLRPVIIQEFTGEHVEAMVADPEARRALEVLRPAAVAAFPLLARGEAFGALTLVNHPERGEFTPAELQTAEIASRRAALALDNARLAAASQRVTERLQLSLLSPPVQPDRLELAVRYRPAARGVFVGGDWYDAFLQPDGDTVLVIGDVMGHDIEAAAAMGQVKTLVRGIAFDRREEPAGLLGRVDSALVGLSIPALATALVCRIEQDHESDGDDVPRRLRWASAGHPDPLLLAPDGTVCDLTGPVGPPLGIGWDGTRADGTAPIPDGATLLLFTDGLFERRGISLDEGRDRVRAVLAGAARLPLQELCDRLLEELVGDEAEDDVAVLAVRAHPARGCRSRPVSAALAGLL